MARGCVCALARAACVHGNPASPPGAVITRSRECLRCGQSRAQAAPGMNSAALAPPHPPPSPESFPEGTHPPHHSHEEWLGREGGWTEPLPLCCLSEAPLQSGERKLKWRDSPAHKRWGPDASATRCWLQHWATGHTEPHLFKAEECYLLGEERKN